MYDLWADMTYNIKTESGDRMQPFMFLGDILSCIDEGDPIEPFKGMNSSNWIQYFDREVTKFLEYYNKIA